jgi:hypothetical protein
MSHSNDKFKTLHPDPKKQGVNISREKYEQIKAEILGALRKSELSHTQLTNQIKSKLKKTFNGSVSWYVETVKLDLEARGKIERESKSRNPVYRLKKH